MIPFKTLPLVNSTLVKSKSAKSILMLLASILLTTTASAYDGAENEKKKVVICSTTQVADFARNIVGDDWQVVCVLGPGEDPHKKRPGNDDMIAVGRADLCLENGWHLEGNEWMQDLAKNANKPIATCVEGIKHLEMDEEGQTVKDPHAWFNPQNAWIYVKNIRDAVSKIDPDNADNFAARAELYKQQLRSLDSWIKKTVNAVPEGRRVLITHHDAFGYFCNAYNFKASSPLGWTTAELAGITMERRQEIVDTIRKMNVKSLFIETSVNPEMLNGIASDAGVQIGGELYSDAMGAEDTAGETYIGMMRENVLTIVNALK